MSNAFDQSFENSTQRTSLLGIRFDTLSLTNALSVVNQQLKQAVTSNLYFVNAHCLNTSCESLAYRRALSRASLVLPDGVGVEWGCRLKGHALPANLNGTDLFPHLCELFAKQKKSVFFLGAQPGTAEAVIKWLSAHYPDLKVAGCHHGHFENSEATAVCQTINQSGADILFVAMGVPRQELWITEHQSKLHTRLNIAVGGLFEFYSNNIPRAPKLFRRYKLEWTWRLLQEPRRMWRRYMIGSLIYLKRVKHEHRIRSQAQSTLAQQFDTRERRNRLLRKRLLSLKLCLRVAWLRYSKRLFDITVATFAILLLIPFFPLLALLIKIDSTGPIFFRQMRVGLNGQPFPLLKFRSMRIDAEQQLKSLLHLNEKQDGVMFKIKDDPRVTRLGKHLRRLSIDELPQLWNVLVGDMSIVGPRPALANEVEKYDPRQRSRLDCKPGLTSEWVIAGRNALSFAQQAELDVEYYYRYSFWGDIKILIKTIPIIITGKGAS